MSQSSFFYDFFVAVLYCPGSGPEGKYDWSELFPDLPSHYQLSEILTEGRVQKRKQQCGV